MTIQWDDKLLTGIEEIDNQHMEMFDSIKDILNACNAKKGREESIKIFAFLEDYIIKHFKSEESIMLNYVYPYRLSHLAEHDQFKSVVSELRNELKDSGPTGQFVIKLNRKLVQWLISHICKEDKKLAEHIRNKKK